MTAGGIVRGSAAWTGLFLAAAAAVAGLKVGGIIDSTTGFVLFAASMVLLVPMIRAIARERSACASPAGLAYARRMGLFAFLYVVDLGAAIAVDRSVGVHGWYSLLFALLPTLPILGMIWAMGRYLVEESDEYLRFRTAQAALFGLGVLLAAATFIGFLERFGFDVHPEGWFAVPIWAVGMGVAQAWLSRSDSHSE